MAFTYPTVCPTCGAALTPIVSADPQTAPWGCYGCGRGFFVAELLAAQAAPQAWGGHAGWLSGTTAVAVTAACEGEVVAAQARGTSLRPEMIAVVADHGTLAMLVKRRGVSAAMKQAIQAVLPKTTKRAG